MASTKFIDFTEFIPHGVVEEDWCTPTPRDPNDIQEEISKAEEDNVALEDAITKATKKAREKGRQSELFGVDKEETRERCELNRSARRQFLNLWELSVNGFSNILNEQRKMCDIEDADEMELMQTLEKQEISLWKEVNQHHIDEGRLSETNRRKQVEIQNLRDSLDTVRLRKQCECSLLDTRSQSNGSSASGGPRSPDKFCVICGCTTNGARPAQYVRHKDSPGWPTKAAKDVVISRAHILRASMDLALMSQLGLDDANLDLKSEDNFIHLCGSQGSAGTCHHLFDNGYLVFLWDDASTTAHGLSTVIVCDMNQPDVDQLPRIVDLPPTIHRRSLFFRNVLAVLRSRKVPMKLQYQSPPYDYTMPLTPRFQTPEANI